jgi:hypothetical protein
MHKAQSIFMLSSVYTEYICLQRNNKIHLSWWGKVLGDSVRDMYTEQLQVAIRHYLLLLKKLY